MTIQPVASLKEFFRDALHDALVHQHVAVEDQTEHYVVNLLTLFSNADALYERDAEGESRSRLKPLALMLGEALDAPTHEARFRGLQFVWRSAALLRIATPVHDPEARAMRLPAFAASGMEADSCMQQLHGSGISSADA